MKLSLTILFFLCAIVTNGQYNYYFGNLHSHTAYTDGNQDSLTSGVSTPGKSYYYAKQSYQMDFLGISEHNHYSSARNPGMRVANYALGSSQADTSNSDGAFIALFGMEWGTISTGGHVLTYGVPGLVGWESGSGAWGPSNNYNIFCAKGNYTQYWNVVNSYPNTFSSLAHPQTGDFENLNEPATLFNNTADAQIKGLAIRSGSAFSTTNNYTDPAPASYEDDFLKTLAKGYHIGPMCDHDNHYTTFGRTNQTRTVILAPLLTKTEIINACIARRFYASDDWNTQVTFTVNGNYMGSDIVTSANTSLSISVFDPDAAGSPATDNTAKIEILYGIPGSNTNATVLTFVNNSNTLNFTHTTAINNKFYYFVRITQADGDKIWTAPVWITRTSNPLPVTLVNFYGRNNGNFNELHWSTEAVHNTGLYTIERSANGTDFYSIGNVPASAGSNGSNANFNFIDSFPLRGIQFYRIRHNSLNQQATYSSIIALEFNKPIVRILKVYPNPAETLLGISCEADERISVTINIFDIEGKKVHQFSNTLQHGLNLLQSNISHLAKGTYFLVINRPNQKITETKFLKK